MSVPRNTNTHVSQFVNVVSSYPTDLFTISELHNPRENNIRVRRPSDRNSHNFKVSKSLDCRFETTYIKLADGRILRL